MTGEEFKDRIEESPYSQRELAKQWGVSHTTIQRECERGEVRGLYADAIRWRVEGADHAAHIPENTPTCTNRVQTPSDTSD